MAIISGLLGWLGGFIRARGISSSLLRSLIRCGSLINFTITIMPNKSALMIIANSPSFISPNNLWILKLNKAAIHPRICIIN